MSRRRRSRQAPAQTAAVPAAQAAAALQLPPLSRPVVIDRSRALGRHLRTLAQLGQIRTEAELVSRLDEIYDLVNTLVVGGMDERPASDFWPAFVEMRRQLEGHQGN